MNEFAYIEKNYKALKEELYELSLKCGVSEPTLVCVTKSGSDEELLALVKAGATDLGENRPGEVKRRIALVKEKGFFANMHEIGTLQRNKIKLIADSVFMVHSLDTEKLAKDLDRYAEANSRKIPVLIEINSAREEQKSGVLPECAEEFAHLLKEYKNLIPRGLMTMGPVCEEAELLRPYFRETKKLFDKLYGVFEEYGKPVLSMGMSDSYKIAIEEGSTLVRVGRKLFRKED